jgi:hypothetical protein
VYAVTGGQALFSYHKIRLPEAIERLVQLYEATGKKDEAAEWRRELDATKAAQKVEKKP